MFVGRHHRPAIDPSSSRLRAADWRAGQSSSGTAMPPGVLGGRLLVTTFRCPPGRSAKVSQNRATPPGQVRVHRGGRADRGEGGRSKGADERGRELVQRCARCEGGGRPPPPQWSDVLRQGWR
eukprot:4213182-Pyramimonas_sp.AAC.1